jgi:hypothetical protein
MNITFKVVKTIAKRQPNGKMLEYKQGRILPYERYIQLTKREQAQCKAIAPKSQAKSQRAKSIAWSRAELEYVLKLYLEMANPDGTYDATLLVARHAEAYPERNGQGVNQAACQVRCYDTYVPQEGLTDISTELLKVLADFDAERFWTAVEVLFERMG